MNTINNISFCGVKYTSAGKDFAKSQPHESQQIIEQAERQMKKYKYTNFIVNGNGYAVQYSGKNGIHCYKIKDILFAYNDNNVTYLINNNHPLRFHLNDKNLHKCALDASEDVSKNNSFLNSTIRLASLLEKRGGKSMKGINLTKILNLIKI